MRLVIYDPTDKRLSPIWAAGARLYKAMGWIDAYAPASTIASALSVIGERSRFLDELQIWGHGSPGWVHLGRARYGASDVRWRNLGDAMDRGGLIWLRSCAVFQGPEGQHFARQLSYETGCRVAGHTHDIGHWGLQSGLRTYHYRDGDCRWPIDEGRSQPFGAINPSRPWAPRTVTAMTPRVPAGW